VIFRQEEWGRVYPGYHNKLMELPDYVENYRAHGAGSCGRALGAEWDKQMVMNVD
jgi:hypothetical protein